MRLRRTGFSPRPPRHAALLVILAGSLAWSRAPADPPDADELRAARAHAAHTAALPGAPGARPATPMVYEQAQGSGGLHTAGNVWVRMDNTNYSPGNLWFEQGLARDPGAEWPGLSQAEYLGYASLWVAARDERGARHVDEGDEIRGQLADYARTRHAYDGIRNGRRGVDDDGDGKVDEDFLNGLDDDGDGRIDEDYAAISPDMFATEMLDDTPEAQQDGSYSEQHIALGLRVRRTSFAWPTPGRADFVGVHYEITNITRALEGQGRRLDSVYVGMYWRPQVGPRSLIGATADDRVGWIEMGANGGAPPDTSFKLPALIPQLATARAPLTLIHASHADSALHIFWSADDDGDEGVTPGAGAILLLGATTFPRLGFKPALTQDDVEHDTYGNAPRGTRVNTFRVFYPSVPYSQGGRPITDVERWDAMSNPAAQLRTFPQATPTGSFRALFSTGPFLELLPDSSIEMDVAICVGRADYSLSVPFPQRWNEVAKFRRKMGDGIPKTEFDPHPQSLLEACQEAWVTWQGRYKGNPSWGQLTYTPPAAYTLSTCNAPQADPTGLGFKFSGQRGRETCVMGVPGRALDYFDCRDVGDETGTNYRQLQVGKCLWFDLDCLEATGTCDIPVSTWNGYPPANHHLVDHERWVAATPPILPRMRTVPGDRQIEVLWDDLAQRAPNPTSGVNDFAGFRLYRAAGWKRDAATGLVGPTSDLWQLVGWWAAPGTAGLAGGAAPLDSARNPAVSESSRDTTVGCAATRCFVHPVGYYHFVDHEVTNGFRYFYAITAFSETDTSLGGTSVGQVSRQETARAATESTVVVARTGCASDAGHVKVAPNPYRFRAEWDLSPSSADPTGTHLQFNHLPCGRFTLRIFTLAGDLVRTLGDADARGSGTLEWNLMSRNGQDVKAGVYVYSLESDRGSTVGRFTVIR